MLADSARTVAATVFLDVSDGVAALNVGGAAVHPTPGRLVVTVRHSRSGDSLTSLATTTAAAAAAETKGVSTLTLNPKP